MRYWVYHNNNVAGPYEESELKNLSYFEPETLIALDTSTDMVWQLARDILNKPRQPLPKLQITDKKQTSYTWCFDACFIISGLIFLLAASHGFKLWAAIVAAVMGLVLILKFWAEVKAGGFNIGKFIFYLIVGSATFSAIIIGICKGITKGLESGNMAWELIGLGGLGIVFAFGFLHKYANSHRYINEFIEAHPDGRELGLGISLAFVLVCMTIYFFYPQLVLNAFAWANDFSE